MIEDSVLKTPLLNWAYLQISLLENKQEVAMENLSPLYKWNLSSGI